MFDDVFVTVPGNHQSDKILDPGEKQVQGDGGIATENCRIDLVGQTTKIEGFPQVGPL